MRRLLLATTVAAGVATGCEEGTRQWTAAERVGPAGDYENFNAPSVGMDAAGNAVVAWRQTTAGMLPAVWANRFREGSGWGEAGPAGRLDHFALSPGVAMSPDGWAFIRFTEAPIDADGFPGFPQDAIVRRVHPRFGGGRIEVLFEGTGSLLEVATDGQGHAWAFGIDEEDPAVPLVSRRFERASGWSPPQIVGPAGAPVVAQADAQGQVVAVWVAQTQNDLDIWANRFRPGQGWGQPAVVARGGGDPSLSLALDPSLAVDPSGSALLVFRARRPGRFTPFQVWAARFDVGSGWRQAVPLVTDDVGPGTPHVSVDAEGRGLAAWGTGGAGIGYSRFLPGPGWMVPALLAVPGAAGTAAVRTAACSTGEVFALWEQAFPPSSVTSIWTARFRPATGWGVPEPLQADPARAAGTVPDIAVDSRCRAVAVWLEAGEVRSRRFAEN